MVKRVQGNGPRERLQSSFGKGMESEMEGCCCALPKVGGYSGSSSDKGTKKTQDTKVMKE